MIFIRGKLRVQLDALLYDCLNSTTKYNEEIKLQMNDQFVIPLNAMNNFSNGKYLPTKPTTIID